MALSNVGLALPLAAFAFCLLSAAAGDRLNQPVVLVVQPAAPAAQFMRHAPLRQLALGMGKRAGPNLHWAAFMSLPPSSVRRFQRRFFLKRDAAAAAMGGGYRSPATFPWSLDEALTDAMYARDARQEEYAAASKRALTFNSETWPWPDTMAWGKRALTFDTSAWPTDGKRVQRQQQRDAAAVAAAVYPWL